MELKQLDRTQIEKDASSLPAQAKALRIMGEKSLEKANEFLLGIKDLKDQISQVFDPIIKKAHEAHKEALAQKNKALEPALEAEVYVRGKIREVLMQRERELAAARKAEEEANQAALKKQEDLDWVTGERETDPVDAHTLSNLDFGIANESPKIPTYQVLKDLEDLAAPRVGGTSLKGIWKFRIIDKAKIPLDYMIVDEVKIGKVVRATKGQISIPGIETFEDKTLNVR